MPVESAQHFLPQLSKIENHQNRTTADKKCPQKKFSSASERCRMIAKEKCERANECARLRKSDEPLSLLYAGHRKLFDTIRYCTVSRACVRTPLSHQFATIQMNTQPFDLVPWLSAVRSDWSEFVSLVVTGIRPALYKVRVSVGWYQLTFGRSHVHIACCLLT